ncbi:hypothetical protein FIE12Z_12783 [Fusarium flagelliforme]|uniref:Uncharacterized protein n=1 Tax=Fusarium flagelliforme TaxID=2675880 RepID=A0A395M6L7_9HYPO|nr:hypothetical protein FIE12Z_12783 [Fusarium flagelliforme]
MTTYRADFELVDIDDNIQQTEPERHMPSFFSHRGYDGRIYSLLDRFPVTVQDFVKKSVKYLFNALLFFFSAVLITSIVMILIQCFTDRRGFEKTRPEWPLYKNTRFEECATANTTGLNCTALLFEDKIDLGNSTYDLATVNGSVEIRLTLAEGGLYLIPDYANWCDKVQCLAQLDYKIVPSDPLQAAYDNPSYPNSNILDYLQSASIAGLAIITMFKEGHIFDPHYPHACPKRISTTISMVLVPIHACGVFGLWWKSFADARASDSRPPRSSGMAWFELFILAKSFHTHPYACWFRNNDAARRWTAALIYALAIALWAGGLETHRMVFASLPNQTYSCKEDMFDAAPGSALCPVSQICGNEALLDPTLRIYSHNCRDGCSAWSTSSYYWVFTAIAVLHFLNLAMNGIIRSRFTIQSASDALSKWDTLLMARFILATFLGCFMLSAFMVWDTAKAIRVVRQYWDVYIREGRVSYDVNCHVIHVHMSPWRGLFDVDDESRVLRVMRPWFHS